MTGLTLGKDDRLKKRKVIGEVFSSGKSVRGYPVQIVWTIAAKDGSKSVRGGFSVPKRKIRKAVQRNLIKRRMKEAYRLNRSLLDTEELAANQQIVLMCIYMTNELLSFKQIEKGMVKAISRINLQKG